MRDAALEFLALGIHVLAAAPQSVGIEQFPQTVPPPPERREPDPRWGRGKQGQYPGQYEGISEHRLVEDEWHCP